VDENAFSIDGGESGIAMMENGSSLVSSAEKNHPTPQN